jgi:hypothetical protein
MLAFSAQATNLVTNGSFETVVHSPPGLSFLITANNTTEVPGWVTTSGVSFLLYPGTATTPVNGISLWPGCQVNSTLTNCINPVPFPYESPDKGNFIAVDGDIPLSGTLSQIVNGLVKDQFYNVSFYQMAGQLNDQRNPNNLCCTGPTTEQWDVSLGTEHHFSTPLMQNDSQSFVGWNLQTLTFKATVTGSEVLGFFAKGAPPGIPPFVLLDGVCVTAAVDGVCPEPATYALMGIGLLGILAVSRQQQKRA